jgi:hypothetical protein
MHRTVAGCARGTAVKVTLRGETWPFFFRQGCDSRARPANASQAVNKPHPALQPSGTIAFFALLLNQPPGPRRESAAWRRF